MIAEAGIITSSRNCDTLMKEFHLDFGKSYFNTDGSFLTEDFDDFERSRLHKNESHFGGSCSQSSASSECSEDIIGSNEDVTPHDDHDYFNFTFTNLLDNNIIADPVSLYELSLGAEEDLETFEGTLSTSTISTNEATSSNFSQDHVQSNANANKTNSSKAVNSVNKNKPWSSMTHLEQVETVENLTQIISAHMGLREQLDIIRIIEPAAIISPTDTEFVINLSTLNNEKLEAVCDYVRHYQTMNRKKEFSSNKYNKKDCNVEPTSWQENTQQGTKQSKKDLKERRNQQKVARQRQQKEHRQILKERRSGLFVKEEVLSLIMCPEPEENIDIDILE